MSRNYQPLMIERHEWEEQEEARKAARRKKSVQAAGQET